MVKYSIFALAVIILLLTGIFGNVISIGYFLYLWGAAEVAISLAAWSAFILWLKLIGVAFVSLIVAVLTRD